MELIEKLTQIAYDAMLCFNEKIETNFTSENTVLVFFTPKTGTKVYEEMCKQYFPNRLTQEYKRKGYFNTFLAQAFVGKDKYGILMRSDINLPAEEWFHIILHELSHIYCTTNEIEDGHFYDKYCLNYAEDSIIDGYINAGYAVWRECIADIMANSINPYFYGYELTDLKNELQRLMKRIVPFADEAKQCMSLILAYIMTSAEGYTAETWAELNTVIPNLKIFKNEQIYDVLHHVYDNLHKTPYWGIDINFIEQLGFKFLMLCTTNCTS